MIDKLEENTAVIVVDVQGDFTFDRNGSLAVEGTDNTYLDRVDSETRRLKALGYPVFATQDWHPENHMSFFSNHENKTPFDTIDVDGRPQVLWPPHCIQGTQNARVILDDTLFEAVVRKGMDPKYDSYSGFFDDGGKATGLADLLREKGIKKLIIYGLTTDYCAKFTALDARRLGFEVVLITELCRGVANETTRAALKEMAAAGVSFI
ncbi:MAG TPA: bifunctional nicotinamidase/pyrazinamidase [Desulfobacteraceae bacterium]|mgnify:CR=1 FL=1|nr:bifunctional nicotinamidase/pyrazinamidase [Desulfobacteraceae bacterium]|tara:strand:+ start:1652 stop:2275 length:624 start_codon:yes stop_codon:yes gene_type:complete